MSCHKHFKKNFINFFDLFMQAMEHKVKKSKVRIDAILEGRILSWLRKLKTRKMAIP